MVTFPRRIGALDRKLCRDLWQMKGQSIAIASVIAAGVAMFVMYLSNFESLQRTRSTYYQAARFADVFASVKRAPASLESRIRMLPGVEAVSTRVVADVTLDVPAMAEPATGRLISIPERGRPVLNDVYLRRGRWIDPARSDEVLASEMFANAHGFGVGDGVAALINGRKRWLRIVGIALSPEYVYAIRPGEMIPDKRQFGVFWMGHRALASAFDMEGAFNDIALDVEPGVSTNETIAELDRLVEPYGGRGAIPRSLQISEWTLENELTQLQTFGFLVPFIFLGVAAFILNVALTRALALQRQQIAALKALGYSNRQIAWHYIKWGLVIAGFGAVAGVVVGGWLGSGLASLYNEFFGFPTLDYRVSSVVALAAIVGSLTVAAVGAQAAVRRAVRIPPAEAMRPEPPARYRQSVLERAWKGLGLTVVTRMILRNLERQPARTLVSIVGTAFAVAILVVGLAFIDVMDVLIDHQFSVAMRQDATVSFVEPRPARTLFAMARLPGVMDVEPIRTLPVRLRVGHRSRTLVITALPAKQHLNRVVDRRGDPKGLPPDGLVLSSVLASILNVAPGQSVEVDVLEGARPRRDIPVVGLVDDSMGLQAYMELNAVHRLMREGAVVSGAAVTLDPAAVESFYSSIKATPMVAAVSLRHVMLTNFRDTMAQNMNLQIFLNVMFAGVIAFGVVYNSARVSLSERERELASLRVLGFTRAEISLMLLGELAFVTVAALPVGVLIGLALGDLIMTVFNNEVYRLSFTVSAATVAWSFLIVLVAAIASGLVVRQRLDRLDLVSVLKTRE
jgi:putative ABC transport system permease protein